MNFTPTEERILAILSDRLPHRRSELRTALFDELSEESSVKRHISSLRQKLRQRRMTVACVYHDRKPAYQLFSIPLDAELSFAQSAGT